MVKKWPLFGISVWTLELFRENVCSFALPANRTQSRLREAHGFLGKSRVVPQGISRQAAEQQSDVSENFLVVTPIL